MPPAVTALVVVGFTEAVATAVVTGVIAGAVVGAAGAAMSGGNVLKGALKGALIGGATAGVFSAASAALAPAITSPTVAASSGVEGAMSASTDGMLGSTLGMDGVAAAPEFTLSAPAAAGQTGAISAANASAAATPTAAAQPGLLERAGVGLFGSGTPTAASEGTSKVIGGIGQGLFQGAGNYLSAKDTADANQKLAEFNVATAQNQRASNIPGQFNAQVIKIGAADWWNQRIDPSQINAPLTRGVANA